MCPPRKENPVSGLIENAVNVFGSLKDIQKYITDAWELVKKFVGKRELSKTGRKLAGRQLRDETFFHLYGRRLDEMHPSELMYIDESFDPTTFDDFDRIIVPRDAVRFDALHDSLFKNVHGALGEKLESFTKRRQLNLANLMPIKKLRAHNTVTASSLTAATISEVWIHVMDLFSGMNSPLDSSISIPVPMTFGLIKFDFALTSLFTMPLSIHIGGAIDGNLMLNG